MNITPSMLESYRLYEAEEWMTADKLRQSLFGRVSATKEMETGTLIHSYLEGEKTDKLTDHAREVIRNDIGLYKGVPEVGGSFAFSNGIVVSGRADRLYGNEVHEFKTTARPINIDRYMESYQWRAYLLMFKGFKRVRYFIMKWKEEKGTSLIDIVETLSFALYPYHGMEKDVLSLTNRLISFINKEANNG